MLESKLERDSCNSILIIGQVHKLTIFDCPMDKFFILLIIKIERGIILWATGSGGNARRVCEV